MVQLYLINEILNNLIRFTFRLYEIDSEEINSIINKKNIVERYTIGQNNIRKNPILFNTLQSTAYFVALYSFVIHCIFVVLCSSTLLRVFCSMVNIMLTSMTYRTSRTVNPVDFTEE